MTESTADLGLPPTDGLRSRGDLRTEQAEFLGINLDALRNLAIFASLGNSFTVALAEVGFAADADWVIEALQQRPECQDIDLRVLDFSGTKLKSLLPELTQALATSSTSDKPMGCDGSGDKPIVFIVRGLESSIGIVVDYPPFLQDLNYVRDVLAQRVPHPIIFVLPKYAAERMARFARDFWSWISLSVEFQSVRQQVEAVQTAALTSDRLFHSDRKPVKQDRIDQLQRLLDQYAPTSQDEETVNANIRLDILLELGDAYWSLADLERADRWFRRAVELAVKSKNPREHAHGLLGLGKVLSIRTTNTKSLTLLKQALEIYCEVGDRLGEANTLREIGNVEQFLNQHSEALSHYDEALTIYREVGDRLGEANTLCELGQLQDHPQPALEYFLDAQAIYKDIDHRYSQGRNLLKFIVPAQAQIEDLDSVTQSIDLAYAIGKDIGVEMLCEVAEQLREQILDKESKDEEK